MSFDNKMIITCDSCNKEHIDTGEKDTQSCNLLASWGGWVSYKAYKKTKHQCPKCKVLYNE